VSHKFETIENNFKSELSLHAVRSHHRKIHAVLLDWQRHLCIFVGMNGGNTEHFLNNCVKTPIVPMVPELWDAIFKLMHKRNLRFGDYQSISMTCSSYLHMFS
jgi:hypothetical protein